MKVLTGIPSQPIFSYYVYSHLLYSILLSRNIKHIHECSQNQRLRKNVGHGNLKEILIKENVVVVKCESFLTSTFKPFSLSFFNFH